MRAETKYDNSRRYWLKVAESDFDTRDLPDILVNRVRKKGWIECQTLDLMKLNQRIEQSHQEVGFSDFSSPCFDCPIPSFS